MKDGTDADREALERRCAELESELAKARASMRAITENAPFGAHRYTLEPDGRLVFAGANAAADRILGIAHAPLLGRTIEEAFPALVTTPIPSAYRAVASGGGLYEDEQVVYEDQRLAGAFEIHAFQSAVSSVTVLFRDITERKKAETALVQKTDELDRYFRHSLDLLCIADTDGYFRRLNPAWERTLGYPVSELEGKVFIDFVHPDDRAGTLAAIAELALQKEVVGFTNRYRHRDGGYRQIEWRSFPVGKTIYAVARDVTERVGMERALRESEERFYKAWNASSVMMAITTIDGRYLEVNTALIRNLGYDREKLIGRRGVEVGLFPDPSRRAEMVHMLESEGRLRDFEIDLRTHDGRILTGSFSADLLTLRDEPCMISLAVDVTARKRVLEEKQKLEAQIQQTQKLESLGVLAGGIAHDFNNLLVAILGYAELARMDLSPLAPAQGNIAEIERAGRRASELCRQMLAYSGKGRFVIERIDLGTLAHEMTHMLEVSISKKAVLKFRFAAGLPKVEADATQMRQVIMNLVINASEAIGNRSGVISISTGAMECDRAYLTSALLNDPLPDGLYVYVEIADTGAGMDEATRSRMFEPFFTTKFTGRGLGLSAVLGIVRGHRGAIKVYSEEGQGTTFKILLPAAPGVAEEIEASPGPPLVRGQGTILFVDDEETVRALGKRALEKLGYGVLLATNGREALALFEAHRQEIAAVILDLTMPHMDGEETFRELRRIDAGVRVVLSSGYNEQDVTQRFVGKGLAGFIQKPYPITTLSETLRAVLGR
jgi:two-component system, cell cycle sensor histidine kinase and response regulator CckA